MTDTRPLFVGIKKGGKGADGRRIDLHDSRRRRSSWGNVDIVSDAPMPGHGLLTEQS